MQSKTIKDFIELQRKKAKLPCLKGKDKLAKRLSMKLYRELLRKKRIKMHQSKL